MKKTHQKAFVAVMAIILLAALIAPSASACMVRLYNFDTWTGEGDATVSLDQPSALFIKLTYGESDVASSNYTVMETNNNTIITLKEEYIKTLKASGSGYSFWATISAEGLSPSMADGFFSSQSNTVTFMGLDPFLNTLVKMTYGGDIIDSVNYTVTANGCNAVVTIKEEYLKTLTGNKQFVGYFEGEYFKVVLQLKDATGDLNGDGQITAADARMCLRASAKLITLTEQQKKVADIFGDGNVSAACARKILRVSAKLESFN
ncbi:MAG: dockerin type I repeat-containing protein [Oscillospiraceae bacterium]|jgi:hypothetical protein|nr:dockerin type I repeat-containing protein [Oscillospiraceae bacterium]